MGQLGTYLRDRRVSITLLHLPAKRTLPLEVSPDPSGANALDKIVVAFGTGMS